MSYKVIARKYRPSLFEEVVGQEHVTRTLANAIASGRVAHAYIFAGVRGVGKTTTARILAKALNCAKGPTAEPDNTCDSCREITEGRSLDVLEIDAASNRGIDQIRELREMVRYAPAKGRNKVVILDEAHQLTDEASNALLKTLEEPPEGVIFILATTRAEDLVETIKSRAQLFNFHALEFKEIAGEIERIAKLEKLKIEPGAVAVLARAAQGSLRDGLSLMEQAIAYSDDTITDANVRELLGVVAESVSRRSGERDLRTVDREGAGTGAQADRGRTKFATLLPRVDPAFPELAGDESLRRGIGSGGRAQRRTRAVDGAGFAIQRRRPDAVF